MFSKAKLLPRKLWPRSPTQSDRRQPLIEVQTARSVSQCRYATMKARTGTHVTMQAGTGTHATIKAGTGCLNLN